MWNYEVTEFGWCGKSFTIFNPLSPELHGLVGTTIQNLVPQATWHPEFVHTCIFIKKNYELYWGTAVAQWLRYCATLRKVAGSIPDGVTGIFHWHTPSDRTMALGSTQPLTEVSTRSLPGGEGGRCVRLTTLPPSCAVVKKSGKLNFMEPSGPPQADNGTALSFFF
jgi:hypothetical protein